MKKKSSEMKERKGAKTLDKKNIEEKKNPTEWDIHWGKHEIIISQRYEFFYLLNDIMIAVWFIIGSILFFSETTTELGTWLFLIGSIELLIRPLIRILRSIHLKRIG